MKLNQLTIKEARKGLEEKKFSAVELTQTCLRQIKRVDRKVKAFITVCPEEALDQARKADAQIKRSKEIKDLFGQYPLLGIPIAIKDNFCTKGIKTTAASKVLKDYIPPYDATVVKRLKEAGVVIIGKTNMDAWAHGSSTEASQFFTTKNPWNLRYLPGGSSGGSAAAVASHEVIAGIGSETAGSIRQPASWCGVVGLKPTYGRVSRYGLIAMCSSTDSPGPTTKTVEDALIALEALAGFDVRDATSSSKKFPRITLNKSLKGLKIGLPKQYFLAQAEKQVNMAVEQAAKVLEKLGAKLHWINLLNPKYSIGVYAIIQRSEVSSNLARFDGVRYGSARSLFGDEAKRRIMFGTHTLSAGYYEAYYQKAQKVRTLIVDDFNKAFKKVDVLLSPASPSVALGMGASKDAAMFGELQDILFEASSMAGLPGISLPCGFGRDNLPIGFQVMAPQFREDLVLNVAYAYQQATDWHTRKPRFA